MASKSKDEIVLWEKGNFFITTPANPHISLREGRHLVVFTKEVLLNAWSKPAVSTRAFRIATQAAKILIGLDVVQWANLQCNSNWGFLSGKKPRFHIHIYGRNRSSPSWGKTIPLPTKPGTFNNKSMPAQERALLKRTFKELL